MFTKRECFIQDKVQIICPYCNGVIKLPMCKAVNGEEITCPHCQKKFNFGM